MSNHTPTPWTVEFLRWTPESETVGFRIDSGYSVDHLPAGMRMHSIVNANCSEQPAYTACWTTEQIEANAAFIVRAVNAHDDLVAALDLILKRAVPHPDDTPEDRQRDMLHIEHYARKALAALAKADPTQ